MSQTRNGDRATCSLDSSAALDEVLERARKRLLDTPPRGSVVTSGVPPGQGPAQTQAPARVPPSQAIPHAWNTAAIVERLSKKFTAGDRPSVRMRLYERVAAIVARHGEGAYQILSATVAESGFAGRPDRWFARTIKLRLLEAGYWTTEGEW